MQGLDILLQMGYAPGPCMCCVWTVLIYYIFDDAQRDGPLQKIIFHLPREKTL
jgi:hypothetical protein